MGSRLSAESRHERHQIRSDYRHDRRAMKHALKEQKRQYRANVVNQLVGGNNTTVVNQPRQPDAVVFAEAVDANAAIVVAEVVSVDQKSEVGGYIDTTASVATTSTTYEPSAPPLLPPPSNRSKQ